MSQIASITVDAQHPASLARFWAAVLGGYAVRAYDEAEIARLAARGFTPETDPTVMVDGPGPTLCFQKMQGTSKGRNRWHLDLAGGPREAEVKRLCGLGARVRDIHDDWTTLLDPEGNPFGVLESRAAQQAAEADGRTGQTNRSAVPVRVPRGGSPMVSSMPAAA